MFILATERCALTVLYLFTLLLYNNYIYNGSKEYYYYIYYNKYNSYVIFYITIYLYYFQLFTYFVIISVFTFTYIDKYINVKDISIEFVLRT